VSLAGYKAVSFLSYTGQDIALSRMWQVRGRRLLEEPSKCSTEPSSDREKWQIRIKTLQPITPDGDRPAYSCAAVMKDEVNP